MLQEQLCTHINFSKLVLLSTLKTHYYIILNNNEPYAAFTHAGLTTRYLTESLYKSIFVLSRSQDIKFMKGKESLLKIASMKFEI